MHNAHKANNSIEEGYEVSDMNTKVITFFLIGLFFMMFGAVGAILMVMRGFEESVPSLNTEPASALATGTQQIPDLPHLQMDPVSDRVAIVTENYRQVNSYGMVSSDKAMKRVHIPVDSAMERIADGSATYRQTPASAQLPATEQ